MKMTMNKQPYQSPRVKVVEMQQRQMLCESPVSLGRMTTSKWETGSDSEYDMGE